MLQDKIIIKKDQSKKLLQGEIIAIKKKKNQILQEKKLKNDETV